MIVVSSLRGDTFSLNPDLIERVSDGGQTRIHMVDGKVHVVTESFWDVNEQVAHYRAYVLTLAAGGVTTHPGARRLRTVEDSE